jgi:hypothetical protein
MKKRSQAKIDADRRRHEKIMADPEWHAKILEERRQRAKARRLADPDWYAAHLERRRIHMAKYRAKLKGVEWSAPEQRTVRPADAVTHGPFAALFQVAA